MPHNASRMVQSLLYGIQCISRTGDDVQRLLDGIRRIVQGLRESSRNTRTPDGPDGGTALRPETSGGERQPLDQRPGLERLHPSELGVRRGVPAGDTPAGRATSRPGRPAQSAADADAGGPSGARGRSALRAGAPDRRRAPTDAAHQTNRGWCARDNGRRDGGRPTPHDVLRRARPFVSDGLPVAPSLGPALRRERVPDAPRARRSARAVHEPRGSRPRRPRRARGRGLDPPHRARHEPVVLRPMVAGAGQSGRPSSRLLRHAAADRRRSRGRPHGALRLGRHPRPRHPGSHGAGARQPQPDSAAAHDSQARVGGHCHRHGRTVRRRGPDHRHGRRPRIAHRPGGRGHDGRTEDPACRPVRPPGWRQRSARPVAAVLLAIELLLFEFRARSSFPWRWPAPSRPPCGSPSEAPTRSSPCPC